MLDDVKHSLGELGLTGKEINVYLAMLELGPASVQDVAQKAGVNRTTSYVIIEALQRRGLISTLEEGKKTLFAAENPQRFLSCLGDELSQLEAKKQRLLHVMPGLLALFQNADAKPKVRFFEGDEAVDLTRQEIAEQTTNVWEMYAVDEAAVAVTKIKEEQRIARTRRIMGRLLVAIKPGLALPYFESAGVEVRVMDYRRYPFSGGIVLSGQHLYVFSVSLRPMGIIVDSPDITNIFRALYDAIWQSAKPWTAPADWGQPRQQVSS